MTTGHHDVTGPSADENLVWYASYASNLSWYRFSHYLEGGVLAETGRHHDGARDPSAPREMQQMLLAGTVYFATESTFWGGGRALYDPDAGGETVARGYLITTQQLSDVLSQEMRLPPVTDWVLPVRPGGRMRIGDGHYETVICTGKLRGRPVVTFTAPWGAGDVDLLAPAPAYLAMLARGLLETVSAWTVRGAAMYLAGLPGVRGTYTPGQIEDLAIQT